MSPDTGGSGERMKPSEAIKVIAKVSEAEKVHINKPLFLWAVACGLAIGTGVGRDIPSLSMAGLMTGGVGLIMAEMYEEGEKLVRTVKKLGMKIEE
jgi:hypothetical protein